MRFTFPKGEKLKSRKQIGLLFEQGSSIKEFPLRIKYLKVNDENDVLKVAFSVPKRNFKLAVDRIRIKRLLRESYRLHKHLLSENLNGTFILMIMYSDKFERSQEEIGLKMNSIVAKLKERLSSHERDA